MKKVPIDTPDSEQDDENVVAEQHVKEIMGPSPTDSRPPSDAASKSITVTDSTEDTDEAVDEPAPEVDEGKVSTSPLLPDEVLAELTASEPQTEPEVEEAVESDTVEATDTEDVDAGLESDIEAENSQPETEETIEEETADNPEINEAIDDIVAKEGDDLLAAEDAQLAAAFVPAKHGLRQKIGNFFSGWWHNRLARRATIIILLLAIIAAATVPTSRYFLMNTAGIRVSASMQILDDSTQQPLKNVKVFTSGQSGLTDAQGKVQLSHLKLGSSTLQVEKRAFAPLTRKVTLGWGSNPLPEFKLSPVGSQYTFVVTDFLSGKPVKKAEATSGEASAVSDDGGKIVLTVDKNEQEELKVVIKAEGYRDEEPAINADDKTEHPLKLVSGRKHVFISKRSGKYDVYSIDIDGKNEKVILSGTGSERDDMTLAPHPTNNVVALVSTRDNKRNKDGYLLSTLTIIDLAANNAATSVVQSERVQLVDWFGDRLVYVQIAEGTSGGNPKRHRMMSYDYQNDESKELAASNYFNDVLSAKGQLYYAPSSAYQTAGTSQLTRSNADGSGAQSLLDKEVWNIFRTDHDTLTLSVQQEWYSFRIGEAKAQKIEGPPANVKTRVYVDSPDSKQSLWVDERDGKGVLLAYGTEAKTDVVLRTQSGLKYPVRWLNNNTIVYRINTDQETADYALNLDGGDPIKIRDVSPTGGVDQWYY